MSTNLSDFVHGVVRNYINPIRVCGKYSINNIQQLAKEVVTHCQEIYPEMFERGNVPHLAKTITNYAIKEFHDYFNTISSQGLTLPRGKNYKAARKIINDALDEIQEGFDARIRIFQTKDDNIDRNFENHVRKIKAPLMKCLIYLGISLSEEKKGPKSERDVLLIATLEKWIGEVVSEARQDITHKLDKEAKIRRNQKANKVVFRTENDDYLKEGYGHILQQRDRTNGHGMKSGR